VPPGEAARFISSLPASGLRAIGKSGYGSIIRRLATSIERSQ
jgi:hypothetical protein